MPVPQVRLEDADNPGRQVSIDADPQTAVSPGSRPGTSFVNTPDGQRQHVVGNYRDVHAKIQDVAARAHESGEAPRVNTGVS